MDNQTNLDTEVLIERLGRFRRWVLPSGVMRELLSRGSDIAPALLQHLTRALAPAESGLEPYAAEAFFCFHLLGVDCQSPGRELSYHEFIEKLLRSDDEAIERCTGEVTQRFVRALIASRADQDDLAAFCNWADSLVQDDRVNQYGKLHVVNSLFNLLGDGLLEDAEAVRWVRKWLDDRKELRQDEFSAMIVADLTDVGGKDLKELATECFERHQIDQGYIDIGSLEDMSDDRQVDLLRERAEADRQLLLDPISYLETWESFAWTADTLDPQTATYDRIAAPFGRRDTKPETKGIDNWLAAIDGSSYEVYPREAIENSHRYVDGTIEQLKDRVGRGVEWAQQGESFSSNAPYLSLLMLAQNCDKRAVLMTDADVFLNIIDLTSEQRYEWFGDTIDTHLIEAIAHVLAGKTQPILQRLDESSRSELDRASLISFFPISVYLGYLSRNQCLDILREIWSSCLHKNNEGGSGYQMILGAIFDAFCLLPIADDDPIVREAEEAGIGNILIPADVAATCRADPSKARDIMKTQVLGPHRLQDAIESGLQFDSAAINPPPAKTERSIEDLRPLSTTTGTVRGNTQKVGRNDPCSCGSGKKYKKCCGKA